MSWYILAQKRDTVLTLFDNPFQLPGKIDQILDTAVLCLMRSSPNDKSKDEVNDNDTKRKSQVHRPLSL